MKGRDGGIEETNVECEACTQAADPVPGIGMHVVLREVGIRWTEALAQRPKPVGLCWAKLH